MTSQHHDPTNNRAEVLSDETDLNALLEAILGDEVAQPATERRQRNDVSPPTVAAATSPQVQAVPSMPAPAGVDPERRFPRAVVAGDHRDTWGFVSEDLQEGSEVADFSVVRQTTPTAVVPPARRPTWRDKLRVSWSKRSLLVVALSATALITASALGLRDEPTPAETGASSAAPALVGSSPLVPGPRAVKATGSSEVEAWAAARAPEKRARVISRTPSRRSNSVTVERTRPPAKPALVEPRRSAPAASPVFAPPSPVELITQPTDRDAAPSRTAIPETEQRQLTDAGPSAPTTGASVVNSPEPAPVAPAPAPVPAAVPRRAAAKLLTGPAPEYPLALQTARIGGSVELLLTIDASGRVAKVQPLTGHPQLRSAAEAAVKRWRYEAARLDNRAVETQTTVRFNFDPMADHRQRD